MIVACQKIVGLGGMELLDSQFLTKGKLYPVLSIFRESGTATKFRIFADDGTPIIVEANEFSVHDATTPSTWSSKTYEGESVQEGYPEVLDGDIMERYFDGDDEEALEALKRVARQASIDTGVDILSIATYSSFLNGIRISGSAGDDPGSE